MGTNYSFMRIQSENGEEYERRGTFSFVVIAIEKSASRS